MSRNIGITIILIGVGITLMSVLFASGYSSSLNFIENISYAEVVLKEGVYNSSGTSLERGYYLERLAIPLRYPLAISVVLILIGNRNHRNEKELKVQVEASEFRSSPDLTHE